MNMNKALIYSNDINSTELLRSLSLKGINTFGLEIFKFNDLLEDTNIRLGFPIKGKILTKDEITEKVLSFFLDKVSLRNPSFQDINHFLTTFSSIRMNIRGDEKKEIFDLISKHEDIKSLCYLKEFAEAYFSSLGDDFDQISFAHKIIDLSVFKGEKAYNEVFVLDDYMLTPLEEELLKSVSNKITHIKVIDLYKNVIQKEEIKSIEPRYGTRNEVAHVLKDIMKNNYPQDECQIVLINKSNYINELYKLANDFNLKLTYECGLPINLTDAYKLYKTIVNLGKKYFFDVNGYLNLFSSDSLDLEKLGVTHPTQVSQLLGRMKICFDKDINETYLDKFNYLKNKESEIFDLFLEKIDRTIKFEKDVILEETIKVINEFSKGVSYVIRNYVKDRSANEDILEESVNFIAGTIEYANEKVPQELRESYLQQIDNKYICSGAFNDESIHVLSVNGALSSIRKHTYIVGLNSAFYPGSLTEDFLFSDDLYEELCGVHEITETNLDFKNDYLRSVISTYLSLGVDLSLSYNCQEIKEVRELNPCSVLLEFAEEHFKGKNEKLSDLVKRCSYYDDELNKLSDVSEIAISNKSIVHSDLDIKQSKYKGEDLLQKSFSPSTLPKFLKCPLRFYLDNIECIDNTISYDPLRPMGGSRFGDLFHFVMEKYINNFPSASKEELINFATKVYDLYTSLDRSISDDNLDKKSFLNSVENTFGFLANFNRFKAQTELKVGYGSEKSNAKIGNIFFRGSIDLVIEDDDGKLVIVDYKTGNSIEHIKNDPETCIQGLIYSGLFEKLHHKPISKLVFFYTRYNSYITFDNPCSEESKELLLEKVNLFEDALKLLRFEITPNDDDLRDEACKYCKYENICHKNEEVDEDENNG